MERIQSRRRRAFLPNVEFAPATPPVTAPLAVATGTDSPMSEEKQKLIYYEIRERLFKTFLGIGAVVAALSGFGAKQLFDQQVKKVEDEAAQVDSARAHAVRVVDSARTMTTGLRTQVNSLQWDLTQFKADAERSRKLTEDAGVYASAAGMRASAGAILDESARATMERRVDSLRSGAEQRITRSAEEVQRLRASTVGTLDGISARLQTVDSRIDEVAARADSLTKTWTTQLQQKGPPELLPGSGLALSCGEIWKQGRVEKFTVRDLATRTILYSGNLDRSHSVTVEAPSPGWKYTFSLLEVYDGEGPLHERDDRVAIRTTRVEQTRPST